jgi:integrase/recombinase XerD
VTHLRKRMREELQRRNYSEGTTRAYLQAGQQFALHFGKSPDNSGPDDLRSYQRICSLSASWRWQECWPA